MKYYEFTKTITIHGEIEAESKDVAEKVVELMDLSEATEDYINGSQFIDLVYDEVGDKICEIVQYGDYETNGKITKTLKNWN